jgi:hypothetical protein
MISRGGIAGARYGSSRERTVGSAIGDRRSAIGGRGPAYAPPTGPTRGAVVRAPFDAGPPETWCGVVAGVSMSVLWGCLQVLGTIGSRTGTRGGRTVGLVTQLVEYSDVTSPSDAGVSRCAATPPQALVPVRRHVPDGVCLGSGDRSR